MQQQLFSVLLHLYRVWAGVRLEECICLAREMGSTPCLWFL